MLRSVCVARCALHAVCCMHALCECCVCVCMRCMRALCVCVLCVCCVLCAVCVCVLCVCVCYVYAVCGLCSTIKSGPIYTVGLSFLSQQIQPEIIDLCSSSSSCGEGDDLSFSPVKPKSK